MAVVEGCVGFILEGCCCWEEGFGIGVCVCVVDVILLLLVVDLGCIQMFDDAHSDQLLENRLEVFHGSIVEWVDGFSGLVNYPC